MAVDQGLLDEFQALPVHSPKQHARLSLDPRLAAEIARLASTPPETRQALVQYTITAKWTPPERAVYASVLEGWGTLPEISGVTGMSEAEVSSTVTKLTRKGVLRRISQ